MMRMIVFDTKPQNSFVFQEIVHNTFKAKCLCVKKITAYCFASEVSGDYEQNNGVSFAFCKHVVFRYFVYVFDCFFSKRER